MATGGGGGMCGRDGVGGGFVVQYCLIPAASHTNTNTICWVQPKQAGNGGKAEVVVKGRLGHLPQPVVCTDRTGSVFLSKPGQWRWWWWWGGGSDLPSSISSTLMVWCARSGAGRAQRREGQRGTP